MVEVFAVICAVLLRNQAQDPIVFSIKSRIFSSPIESPRYGGLQAGLYETL